MKTKKKQQLPRKNLMEGGFIRLYQKTGVTDFDELWVTDSELNEGLIL